jgi:hypothetical protein
VLLGFALDFCGIKGLGKGDGQKHGSCLDFGVTRKLRTEAKLVAGNAEILMRSPPFS